MPDLTRDDLIEDIRDEMSGRLIGRGHYLTTVGIDEASELAPIVVDAVLRLVADDLDRASSISVLIDPREVTVGWLAAADRIRSLLPSTEGDQP